MDGLQRSEISFRRQGSSGLVWDDRFLSGELKQETDNPDQDKKLQQQGPESEEPKPIHIKQQTYRTVKDVSPTIDPPSPKVSTCGFCSIFTKPNQKHNRSSAIAKRKFK
ncbi:uncharacterized protein At1g15400-like [Impatiens glandulifera]|uniref:uncharacterized protein At1g15400-like n=1 Tax=Impatiens glandulifera TaxID=253017 RepID=UPI001FB1576E|nr:uncharacterized protein At1g15400-like [Impatiens glandulifera]